MPTFTLDGKEIPFEAGDTIIQAAWRQGIEIPHYCWHPGLSVAANCRMCLVEIKSARPMALPVLAWDEKKQEYVEATKPKLQPACQIEAQPGMEVFAESDQAKQAHAAVQEFLLLNHPVDCPICDQAGECKLQDYWLTTQKSLKRKKSEPVHKPKGVRFGPTIVYDAERCIMCTRCIRFCDEVVGDHVLDMRERGNTNEICLSPGRELDNDYSLMTEHVCPVGALTSRDFRFKARVWFLRAKESVCTGCATGCNSFVDFDPRYQRVYRLRPRDNEAVNKFWMCDQGMMTYKRFQEDRIVTGRARRRGRLVEISRESAVEGAVHLLNRVASEKVGVVLSAQASNEDNLVLARFASDVLGSERLYLAAVDAKDAGWEGDEILKHPDPNPNRLGALAVAGGSLGSEEDLVADIESGAVEAVISLGWATGLTESELAPLHQLPSDTHINLTTNSGRLTSAATVVIPVASVAETNGSFTNAKGMVQRFQKAVRAPGDLQAAWETLLDIAVGLKEPLPFKSLADVRKALLERTKKAALAAEAASQEAP